EAEGVDDRKSPPRSLLAAIQRWKDRGLTPERITAAEAGDLANGRGAELYAAYQARLRALNACDFGDLKLHNITLFQKRPEILASYQQRFRYLLVDEYQDINVAQYLWLRLLAQGHRNLCCVGDDDQSIYGWRGAEVGNILRFETDFPGAKVVRLERNYRSTGRILAAASGLIAHNDGRLGKTLWTEDEAGPKLRVRGLWDGEAEARFVGEEIEDLQRKGHKLSEIAILVRAGSQTRSFEDRFLIQDIPYRLIGGVRFYERQEIRDVVAYLRVINQADDDLAFERIVNVPRRGLGGATLQAIHRAARAGETALTTAANELIGTDELRPQARRSLGNLLEDFRRWRAVAQDVSPAELVETVVDESGYAAMWKADKSADAPGRLENLKELVLALEEFESLGDFLEHVALVMEHDDAQADEKVNVMTLHGAKGLEFDVVFLPGWEEGLFPHQRALDEQGSSGLEEERRLAYVGLTRARKKAYVSFAANRRLYNLWQSAIPSRFVDELPPDHVEVDVSQGLHSGQAASAADSGYSPLFPESGITPTRRHRSRARHAAPDTGDTGAASSEDGAPAKGTRVFHQKFGYGRVVAVDGTKLEIAFEKAGRKKVMAGFVEPA
ncbi:MAG TPA: 3'-5' exonuclease, partial [Alphaproteobacteria bacterium]|nr:3'-5' exonuclease [Alphaproteobacteria bacterium]